MNGANTRSLVLPIVSLANSENMNVRGGDASVSGPYSTGELGCGSGAENMCCDIWNAGE